MNKTQLIDYISNHSEISKTEAKRVLDSVITGVTESLKNKESVAILGFGTFSVEHRAERTGRNPRTGDPLIIKASNLPKFKAGTALKKALN